MITEPTTDICPHCQQDILLRHWTVHTHCCELGWLNGFLLLQTLDSREVQVFERHVRASQLRRDGAQT